MQHPFKETVAIFRRKHRQTLKILAKMTKLT